jgi:antitoxin VapB
MLWPMTRASADASGASRRAKVFRNGRSRAVRIPKEFEFEGDEVIMRREANGVLSLEPVARRMSPAALIDWLRAQPPLDEDFPDVEDFLPRPFDLDLPE